jgi:hypothetical protein
VTSQPTTFQTYLQHAATGILERIPEQVKPQVYVLAFNIWRVDADDRHPYVDIGWNTEAQFEKEMSQGAPDPREARWNYAYWLLEGFDKLGNVPEDQVGSALHEAESRELGDWYDGAFNLSRVLEDPEIGARADRLHLRFATAVIGLARHLHSSGTVERVFGRPLPVVIFNMDCPGWEEEATKAANPPELIEDFLGAAAGAGPV